MLGARAPGGLGGGPPTDRDGRSAAGRAGGARRGSWRVAEGGRGTPERGRHGLRRDGRNVCGMRTGEELAKEAEGGGERTPSREPKEATRQQPQNPVSPGDRAQSLQAVGRPAGSGAGQGCAPGCSSPGSICHPLDGPCVPALAVAQGEEGGNGGDGGREGGGAGGGGVSAASHRHVAHTKQAGW